MRLLIAAAALLLISPAAAQDAGARRSEAMTTSPSATNAHDASASYPQMSRKLGEEGSVTLTFVIGTDGRVHRARVVHSSGHPRLDRAALDAVAAWTYKPARRGGEPIAVNHTVKLDFTLPGAAAATQPKPAPTSLLALLSDPALAPGLIILALLVLAVVGSFYLLPALVAYHRVHPSLRGVFVVNLLLGWTVLGWIGTLIWAIRGSNPHPYSA